MRAVLLAAIASIGMIGCVDSLLPTAGGGDDDSGPSGSNVAKQMFDSTVYPTVQRKCSGCHLQTAPSGNGTGFVAPTVATAHETIVGYGTVVGNFTAATAGVLLRIQGGDHHGVTAYTSDEVNEITAWLDQEVKDHNGTPSPTGTETPAAAAQRLMSKWSGCMTLDMFNAANMADAWGTQMTANNNQACSGCHASGAERFIASPDAALMFMVISTNKDYMLQYFSVDGLDKPATAQLVINTKSFDGVSKGLPPSLEHPLFNAIDNIGMTALKAFYASVDAAVKADATTPCGPSKLTN